MGFLLVLAVLASLEKSLALLPQFKNSIEAVKHETQESGMLSCVFTFQQSNDAFSNCSSCNTTITTLKNLSNELKYSLNVFFINCSDPDTLAHAHYNTTCKKQLPEITIVDPGDDTYDNSEPAILNDIEDRRGLRYHVIQSELPSLKGLLQFIDSLQKFRGDIIITEKDWNNFMNESTVHLKKLLFFQQGGNPLNLYKILSIYYYRRFEIALINTPDHSLNTLLKIEGEPSVVLLNSNLTMDEHLLSGMLLKKSADSTSLEDFVKLLNVNANFKRLRRESWVLKIISDRLNENIGYDFYKLFAKTVNVSLSPKNFNKLILQSEKIFLVHVFKENQPHWAFDEIKENVGAQIDYGLMNCTSSKFQKFLNKTFGVIEYPALIFITLPRDKNYSGREIILNRVGTISDLLRKISDMITDKSKSIKGEEDLGFYLTKSFEARKTPVILFHNKTGVLSQSFRALTNMKTLNEYFRFFNIYNASAETLTKFKIKSLPRVVSLLKTERSTEVLQFNKAFSFLNLTGFLMEILQEINKQTAGKTYLPRVKNLADFNRICPFEPNLVCFLLVVALEKSRNDFVHQIETFEKFLSRPHPQNRRLQFAWLNFDDFPALKEALEIEPSYLPKMIAFLFEDINQMKYSQHVGAFSLNSMENFILDIVGGRRPKKSLNVPLERVFMKKNRFDQGREIIKGSDGLKSDL